MKTIKQITPFLIAMAIVVLTWKLSTWLFEQGYISKLWDNAISVTVLVMVLVYFISRVLKQEKLTFADWIKSLKEWFS